MPLCPRTGVSIVMESSICSFESSRSSRKFSKRIRFVTGSLLLRIGAFQSNHAVNPFSQLSASERDMSRLRFIFGFRVFSSLCGLESWEGGVGWLSQCGGILVLLICSCEMSLSTSASDSV